MRQSGLPRLKLADLARDGAWLAAREVARAVVAADQLAAAERTLRQILLRTVSR